MAKDADYKRLIHSTRWLRLRRSVLCAHPLCKNCEEEGYITAAVEVHHVVPVESALTYAEKERLMFDENNLRPLCHACHVKVHYEMGRCGKKLNKQRNEEKLQRIIDRFFGGTKGGGVF